MVCSISSVKIEIKFFYHIVTNILTEVDIHPLNDPVSVFPPTESVSF